MPSSATPVPKIVKSSYVVTTGLPLSFAGLEDQSVHSLVALMELTSPAAFHDLTEHPSHDEATAVLMRHYTSEQYAEAMDIVMEMHAFHDLAKTAPPDKIKEAIVALPPRLLYNYMGRLPAVGQMVYRALAEKEGEFLAVLGWLATQYPNETMDTALVVHDKEGNVHTMIKNYGHSNPLVADAIRGLFPEPAPAATPMKRAVWSPIVDDGSVPHPNDKSPPGPPKPKKQKSTTCPGATIVSSFPPLPTGVGDPFAMTGPGSVPPPVPPAIGVGHPSAAKSASK